MDTMMTLKKWQDEYFTLVKRVEEPVVRFTDEQAETVARFVPARPSFMAKMPAMVELVDNQLKFRKRFVEEQVAFIRKMMKAMDPVFTKMDTVAKPVAHTPARPMVKTMARPTTRTAPRRMTKVA